jgi:hypothetical protein
MKALGNGQEQVPLIRGDCIIMNIIGIGVKYWQEMCFPRDQMLAFLLIERQRRREYTGEHINDWDTSLAAASVARKLCRTHLKSTLIRLDHASWKQLHLARLCE